MPLLEIREPNLVKFSGTAFDCLNRNSAARSSDYLLNCHVSIFTRYVKRHLSLSPPIRSNASSITTEFPLITYDYTGKSSILSALERDFMGYVI